MQLGKPLIVSFIFFVTGHIAGQIRQPVAPEIVRIVDVVSFDNPIKVEVFNGENDELLKTYSIRATKQTGQSSHAQALAQNINPMDAKKRHEYLQKVADEYKNKTFIELQLRENGKWDWIKVTEGRHKYSNYRPSGNDKKLLLYVGPDMIHGINRIHKIELPE